MTAVFLRSWGCRLLKGGVGWRGGAGIFRFPPKLTVSHFKWKLKIFFFCLKRLIGPYVLVIASLYCDHQTLPCVSDGGFTRHLLHHPDTLWPLLGYIPDRNSLLNA